MLSLTSLAIIYQGLMPHNLWPNIDRFSTFWKILQLGR